jgi:CIC family chloride channel protein
VDALPVQGTPGSPTCGMLTRALVRRFLSSHHANEHAHGQHLVAPTEAAN